MAGGFESLGLLPELVRAVEVDLGWLLPTDVQDEAIPLILGGGDVMAAAETGSGKTAAFSLPVLQLVEETHRKEAESKGGGGGAGGEGGGVMWRMSDGDRDPLMSIAGDGVTCQVMAPRWVGGRASTGIKSGAVYYEATLLDKGLGRFGWSTMSANYSLGTDANGLGYGGTGMKSRGGKFDPYGESFSQGDVIGCYLDLTSGVVGFSKNGVYLGEAFRLETGGGPRQQQQAFFPAIVLKQAQAKLNFCGPFAYPPEAPYIGVGQAPPADLYIPGGAARQSQGAGGGKGGGGAVAPLALILEPARDLAEQVYNCVMDYKKYLTGIEAALVVGGTDHGDTMKGLKNGADIVVATTGKLGDMIKRGQIQVDRVRFFILDEADRLLETGNLDDIMNIYNRLPKGGAGDKRLQVCFFSATLHSTEINQLSEKICDHPTWVDLKGKDSVPTTVHHVVVEVEPSKYGQLLKSDRASMYTSDGVHLPNSRDTREEQSELIKRLKPLLLVELIDRYDMEQCLIFCRTNLDCDLLEQFLIKLGGGRRFSGKVEKGVENRYSCCVLAGMRSMQERRVNLQAFKEGDVRFLICTDVAARGIDIQGLPYVINMTLPDVTENYIHRVGRVGRADCVGLAISLVASNEIKEKVWFHTCANRGKNCSNRGLKDQGGCTIWYDEPDLLHQVETRLHVDCIPRLTPPKYELPEEIKALLGDAKYGQSVSTGPVDEAMAKHMELLHPAVAELAELEYRAQTTWLGLRVRFGR